MKTTGITATIICGFLLILSIIGGITGEYQYERDYKSFWDLADKASTIPQKAQYVDKFVDALANAGMDGKYNAIFLTTPDNSFDRNFEALKSLQLRLHEIELMGVTSFEYQTAMQQITGQEQGEAENMLDVFNGIWWKTHHFLLWDWICLVQVVIILGIGLIYPVSCMVRDFNEY